MMSLVRFALRLLVIVSLVLAVACSRGSLEGEPGPASIDSLETILTHADNAYREGDYKEAQQAYEAAHALSPENGDIVARLANCYFKNRVTKRAQGLLESYLGSHPDHVGALLVLARVYLRQAQLAPAGETLEKVLSSDPDNLLAHYNLGFISYRSRRYETAEHHLRRTIELSPDHPEAHRTLGLTYLAQSRLEDAIASLERTLEVDPRHVGAYFNLANACARAGRMQEAEAHQRRYAELSGRSEAEQERETQIVTLSVKAKQHLLARRFPEALTEYQALATQYPDHAPLFKEIGRLQWRLGERDRAIESLRKAVDLDPRLSEPHYLLAGLYREMGDTASADRELEVFAMLETIPEGKSRY
jgi:tetratricopeptide (TPR) repeat protein